MANFLNSGQGFQKTGVISRIFLIKTKNKPFLSFFQMDNSISKGIPNIKHNIINQNIVFRFFLEKECICVHTHGGWGEQREREEEQTPY